MRGKVNFELKPKDLKQYPHFDQLISRKNLEALIFDPDRVRTHSFHPFIEYPKKHQPFRSRPERPEPKERLIRYASRRDSVIYKYYRHLLSAPYEANLHSAGLQDCAIAYRKIPLYQGSKHGKCNIDFAKEVFDVVRRQKTCVAIALDISKYFECIDHGRLYTVWCRLLGVRKLPQDHLAVFKAITCYSTVSLIDLYHRLGFIGPKGEGGIPGYLKTYDQIKKDHTQLCSPQVFRNCVVDKAGKYPPLIKKNKNDHGIPQGAPISDLLANAYLYEFDKEMLAFANEQGGRYWRYSDDLMFVLPGGAKIGQQAKQFAIDRIKSYGEKIQIKPEKTSIVRFTESRTDHLNFQLIDGKQGRNGLEYLGFRFDGQKVYLRDSTVSNLYRKITSATRVAVKKHLQRYQGKSCEWLIESFNYQFLYQKFGKVKGFHDDPNVQNWTFWTYAKRAAEKFGKNGFPIYKQIGNYQERIRKIVERDINKVFCD